LTTAGCDIIRVTVPDNEALAALPEICRGSAIPVVADIHFDYRLAIGAVKAGVSKVRINPGNIGSKERVKEVIDCCRSASVPIRIGINGGSLPGHLIEKYGSDRVSAMIACAVEETAWFEEHDFTNVVLSFKSSNVLETIVVNRLASKKFPYPLHIGVTEAGDVMDGTVKNSIGIGVLLQEGIGNTIRVSLTAPELSEVQAGLRILESCGKRQSRLEIISCPTCGRTDADIVSIVAAVKKALAGVEVIHPLKIAVMGCMVNGPGEAKGCDFGVACGKKKSILFKDGMKIKTVNNNRIIDELLIIASGFTR
jgi:(E)-4-hydroxy-3-methylbut-2-enyl-diphosphate synthase